MITGWMWTDGTEEVVPKNGWTPVFYKDGRPVVVSGKGKDERLRVGHLAVKELESLENPDRPAPSPL